MGHSGQRKNPSGGRGQEKAWHLENWKVRTEEQREQGIWFEVKDGDTGRGCSAPTLCLVLIQALGRQYDHEGQSPALKQLTFQW